MLRGWKHSDTQKLVLTACRGAPKKTVGTMFRTKYSGKAYRHTEHLLESLKGWSWKGASRRGKTDDALYVCLLQLTGKIFKKIFLKRVIYFWLFYHKSMPLMCVLISVPSLKWFNLFQSQQCICFCVPNVFIQCAIISEVCGWYFTLLHTRK